MGSKQRKEVDKWPQTVVATADRHIAGDGHRGLITRDLFEDKGDHHCHLMVYSSNSLGLVVSHDNICLPSGRRLK